MNNKKYTITEYSEDERIVLEDYYNKSFENKNSSFIGKDFDEEVFIPVKIKQILSNGKEVIAETDFGQSIIIDIKKEEKILKKMGYSSFDFSVGNILNVLVRKRKENEYIGSIIAGHKKLIHNELMNSIKEENSAFKAKVLYVCNGGFMVDVSGLECFLPGSLAAANKILDFNKYVGKEIIVMPEMYDYRRKTFVVSFKKYLKKIIADEIQTLSYMKQYVGNVTGSSDRGVFVEWNEMFTGLIPFDENNKKYLSTLKPGDEISFYIMDIKGPEKIILGLSKENISQKNILLQEFKDNSEEVKGKNEKLNIYIGEITKIKTFGVFVKFENSLLGLIEKESLLKDIQQYNVGQNIKCNVISVDMITQKIKLIEVE